MHQPNTPNVYAKLLRYFEFFEYFDQKQTTTLDKITSTLEERFHSALFF